MSENKSKMEVVGYVPKYPDVKLYGNVNLHMVVWEADPWKETSLSWKKSCYIHAGISGAEETFKGPDAQKLLSMASINDVYKWKPGTSKHLVMCDDDGLIMNHALVHRDGEDTFRMFAGCSWPIVYLLQKGKYNVQMSMRDVFIYQVAGPLSLTVLERAAKQSFRDVGFLQARQIKIPGVDADIEIARIGMAGTLAYEFRGPAEAGPAVYDIVYQAGKDLDIKRLGWLTYVVNHVEGGFPQMTCSFLPSPGPDKEAYNASPYMAMDSTFKYTGSIDPADKRARLRTPGEVGWTWMVKFNHDFVGCKAVEAEAAKPKRTIVNLRWDPKDIIDIYASQFQQGEEYKLIDFPCGQPQPAGGHADHVTTLDGKKIGISSGTTYSYYYRELISQCIIDVDQAELGNKVIVQWGDYGKRIKNVNAIVARYPYLDLPRNENYDLSTVPSGI
jgi:glycine cleavage system aminomethyltransferase T